MQIEMYADPGGMVPYRPAPYVACRKAVCICMRLTQKLLQSGGESWPSETAAKYCE